MSDDLGVEPAPDVDSDEPAAPAGRGLVRTLTAIITVAVIAIAVAGGFAWGHSGHSGPAAMPGDTSVDAGFARDMSTHHTQAVTMANYERDHTANPDLHNIAYDIETSQNFQIGEMQGWLDNWGLSRTTSQAEMAWMHGAMHMDSDGLMPGLATPDQMTKLETLTGKPLDILFLQLMIHHHQGGVTMAQYAADNAQEPYVRLLASNMVATQNSEIVEMETLLRKLGASPLAPPES